MTLGGTGSMSLSDGALTHVCPHMLTHFHACPSQVLLPRFGMKGDMQYDPEADWLEDNKGQDVMRFPDFFDALFELADMW